MKVDTRLSGLKKEVSQQDAKHRKTLAEVSVLMHSCSWLNANQFDKILICYPSLVIFSFRVIESVMIEHITILIARGVCLCLKELLVGAFAFIACSPLFRVPFLNHELYAELILLKLRVAVRL